MTGTIHFIGELALDISLFSYFVHFIPQILHNYKNPDLKNISVITQELYIVGIACDLIYGSGFGYPWQYILVDFIYLGYLLLQDIQILHKIKSHYKYLIYNSIFICICVLISVYLLSYNIEYKDSDINSSNVIFWVCGYISTIIWFVLWLPQIAKHWKNKNADGYSVLFWIIGLAMALCDLTSAVIFGYTWLNITTCLYRIALHILILGQCFVYSKIKRTTTIA
ncbi:MAG: PQ-loop repeat-containing protein [bacterium]|nr:PQ-loop repeat-containing protein [bacterium]